MKFLLNIFFLFLPLFLFTSVSGQSKKDKNFSNDIETIQKRVYLNSISSGDYSTAITSLNQLVVLSKDSVQYFDSLAKLYFKIGNLNASVYWCNKALNQNSNNVFSLEILGLTYKGLMQLPKAIEIFERLIKQKNNPEFSLYIVECQYGLKRLYECIRSTDICSSLDTSYGFKFYYKDTSNRTCFTNLKSALLNYRGLVYYDLGDYKKSELCFSESLLYDSEFLLAKYNLSILRKEKLEDHRE